MLFDKQCIGKSLKELLYVFFELIDLMNINDDAT